MIRLRTRGMPSTALTETAIGRVTSSPVEPQLRADYVLRCQDGGRLADTSGYIGYLCQDSGQAVRAVPAITGLDTTYLCDGDIVALDPSGQVRTLYRRASTSNFLFATDQCNSYCLMCSQPPRRVDDRWRVRELLRVVSLIEPATAALGITGGEPTLLRNDLHTLLCACRDQLPTTALHVLSNGRLFYYPAVARRVASVAHPDLVFGIPVYSDVDWLHDHVVQSQGAFDQTMIGLQNLAAVGVAVEIRVVISRLTAPRLLPLAEFLYRNLTFASHIVFMGLEPIGFAVPNLTELWLEPTEYGHVLEEAVWFLSTRGMRVSIYNHQLCTVPESVWPFCVASISDWKNEYLPVCDACGVRSQCGGFFSSNIERMMSSGIRPLVPRTSVTLKG